MSDFGSLFPLLFPLNETRTRFVGYLTVDDEDYQISIDLKSAHRLDGAEVRLDGRLEAALGGAEYRDVIEDRLRQCDDLTSFLNDLKQLASHSLKRSALRARREIDAAAITSATRVFRELEAVGWRRVEDVSVDLKRVTLVAEADFGELRRLTATFSPNYPHEAPEIDAELPAPFEFEWTPRADLSKIFGAFKDAVAEFEGFWEAMRELDAEAIVLEPASFSPGAGFRRVALDQTGVTSLLLEFDPKRPRHLPECRFLGPDHIVQNLRLKLQSRASEWDSSISILANLSNVLELHLPAPSRSTDGAIGRAPPNETLICGVCYSYSFDLEESPSLVCDRPNCSQAFHKACLFEWLKALPDCQQSFNTVYGDCPYCSKPIKVTYRRMSLIPFSSISYDEKSVSPEIRDAWLTLCDCRAKVAPLAESHLKPLRTEREILQRFFLRHKAALRHEKGLRLVKRVAQCLDRILHRPEANVIGNAEILTRDATGLNVSSLPSRQTLQHFLAATARSLPLFDAAVSRCRDAFSYLTLLLSIGHSIPAFLPFAASVARVALLVRGLRLAVAACYDALRPHADVLEGRDADLSEYGISALADRAPEAADDDVFQIFAAKMAEVNRTGVWGKVGREAEEDESSSGPNGDLRTLLTGDSESTTITTTTRTKKTRVEDETDYGEVVPPEEKQNKEKKRKTKEKKKRKELTKTEEKTKVDPSIKNKTKTKKKKKGKDSDAAAERGKGKKENEEKKKPFIVRVEDESTRDLESIKTSGSKPGELKKRQEEIRDERKRKRMMEEDVVVVAKSKSRKLGGGSKPRCDLDEIDEIFGDFV